MKLVKKYTDKDEVSVTKYLTELNRGDIITPEEEIELGKRIQQGDKEALDRLVIANLRFVVSVAKQFKTPEIALADLINAGNIGLIEAAKKFDGTKGFKFISYAVWYIRQNCQFEVTEQTGLIKLPCQYKLKGNKLRNLVEKLEMKLERPPAIHEVIEAVGKWKGFTSIEEILSFSRYQSLSDPYRNESKDDALGGTLIDVIQNTETPLTDERSLNISLKQDIQECLYKLNPKEKLVMELYYGLTVIKPLTLEEIAVELDLGRERVRQMLHNSLIHLKTIAKEKKLHEYLK